MKKTRYYLITFLLAICIFLLISTIANCVPFGEYIFNSEDSLYMYPGLLVHSIRTLLNGNFFYNINSFLGSDFYNVRTLYMNSPLNLLFLFFKENQIFDFFTFLIFLRIGLSSLTMCIYLNSISKDKYTWKQILFSLIYSLSSYGIACSVHIMWMDSFILLPIIILGIDNLITNNKAILYIFTLWISILINFYFGYMTCIFCLIYFIYKAYISNKFNVNTIKKFILSSLLCGLLSCVILIPQIYSLIGGRGNTFEFEKLLGINFFTLLSLPANLISGTYAKYDMLSNGSPMIYCTIFVIVLNILYFFNKKISAKNKKATLALLIFFLFSLSIKFIDYSWNMFQEPVWFSHRYIFVFVFLLTVIAFISFENMENINITEKTKNIILIIFSILAIASFAFKAKVIEAQNLYIIGLYLSIILFFIYLFTRKNKYYKYIVISCVLLEIIYNGYSILNERTSYTYEDGQDFLKAGEYINDLKESDESFYRISIPNSSPNNSMLFDYNSGAIYSSSFDEETRDFLSTKLGYISSTINNMYPAYESPALSSLFSFKYIVGKSTYYPKLKDNIYINNDALSVGFVVPDNMENPELTDFEYTNNIEKIYSSLLKKEVKLYDEVKIENFNIEKFLDQYNQEKYLITYSFIPENDGIITPNHRDLYLNYDIKINGTRATEKSQFTIFESYVDNLCLVKKNDLVEIEIIITEPKMASISKSSNDLEYEFASKILNEKKYREAIALLKEYSQLDNISTQKSGISGTIEAEKGILVLTIPYKESFTILVDGEETEPIKLYNALTGINLEEGKHEITIKYIPKGLKVGTILSALGLVGLIIFIVVERRKNNSC